MKLTLSTSPERMKLMLSTSPPPIQEDLEGSEIKNVLCAMPTVTYLSTAKSASVLSAIGQVTMRVGAIPTRGNPEVPQPRAYDYMD